MAVSVSLVEATRPEELTTAATNLGGKVAGTHLAQAGLALLGIVNSLRGQGWQVSDSGVATPPSTPPPVLKGTAAAWTAIVQRLLTTFDDIDKQTAGNLPKFGALSNEGDGPMFAGGDDRKGEEDDLEERQKEAEETVAGALNGDPEDAARVDSVLDSITEGQIAGKVPLNTEQQQIVSQMGYQTGNMSLQQLSDVRDKLGDKQVILANSWQLLSNPNVKTPVPHQFTDVFPHPEGTLIPGNKDLLPTSIEQILDTPAFRGFPNPEGYKLFELPTENELRTVAGFVADGDANIPTRNGARRRLMARGAEILDRAGESNELEITRECLRDDVSPPPYLTKYMDGGVLLSSDQVSERKGEEFLTEYYNALESYAGEKGFRLQAFYTGFQMAAGLG
jgi:hypothetical protein